MELLDPNKTIDFTWDEPHQPTGKLLEIKVRNQDCRPYVVSLEFDNKRHPDWDVKNPYDLTLLSSLGLPYLYLTFYRAKSKYQLQAGVRGFTKYLFIYEESDPQQKARVQQMAAPSAVETKEIINLDIQLGGIGVSIIDTTPQEITFISFKNLNLFVTFYWSPFGLFFF